MVFKFLARAAVLAAVVMVGLWVPATGLAGERESGLHKLVRTVPPRPVPDIPFLDGSGKQRSIAEFRGKVVLLNFWATWCPPCIREMPSLNYVQAMLKEEGFVVLALSQDRGKKNQEKARAFLKEKNLTSIDLYFDDKSTLAKKVGARSLPMTLLVDKQGNEVARLLGTAEWHHPDSVALFRTEMSK
ncbi:TlpA disulfide reductase family protein [Magnetospira sp. QH-2]|uniref:TlpA family protein disulfide reductase n=1 Tax=Magnetospira sp. (strain QH-2) TaxID=1288970 RepID=UPI0003E811FC|nr:TlpA disulfide reductase family protein [Magnetospira sp. QH-2]CCQ74738.1 putative redoxin domain protein [Magnetospira sp. QH-2]